MPDSACEEINGMFIKTTFERKNTDLHIAVESESKKLPLYRRTANGFFSDMPKDAVVRLGFMACQPNTAMKGVEVSYDRFAFAFA